MIRRPATLAEIGTAFGALVLEGFSFISHVGVGWGVGTTVRVHRRRNGLLGQVFVEAMTADFRPRPPAHRPTIARWYCCLFRDRAIHHGGGGGLCGGTTGASRGPPSVDEPAVGDGAGGHRHQEHPVVAGRPLNSIKMLLAHNDVAIYRTTNTNRGDRNRQA